MYNRVNYTLVGLFVLLLTAGMLGFGFWLAKYSVDEVYDNYKIETSESVSGLSKDSLVKLHGVDIGRVSAIKINPQNIESVEIFLSIKRGIPMKEDMVAHTQMLGVTGLLFVEINGGSNEAKTLKPSKTYVPSIHSQPSFLSKVSNRAEGVSEKFEALLDKSHLLLSDKNLALFSKILENLETLAQESIALEKRAMLSLDELNQTLEGFRESMQVLDAEVLNSSKHFAKMQEDFGEIKVESILAINTLLQTSKNFNRTTLKFEKTLKRGDYNFKQMFEPILMDIQMLTNQFSDMSQELSQSPNSLFFKSRKSRKGPGE